MNTSTVTARLVTELHYVGDFAFSPEEDYLYVILPGTTYPDAIPIARDFTHSNDPHFHLSPVDRVWHWDGNIERPTLLPSILVNGVWHGYLVAGILKSC